MYLLFILTEGKKGISHSIFLSTDLTFALICAKKKRDSIHKDLEVSLSLDPYKVRELARKHIDTDKLSQVIIA